MTPEAQNIAIAESLGWTKPTGWGDAWPSRTDCRFTDNRCATFGVPPGKAYEHYERGPIQDNLRPIPNYHGSLDACAEFEESIPKNDFEVFNAYVEHLWNILERDDPEETHLRLISAKAPQRCEAYLRTLNLWKESK